MRQSNLFTAVVGSCIGSILEMYDFVIYALMSSVLAAVFFPTSTSYMGLIKTFAIFAVGYLARPLGGLIFGHIGDRKGRQKGLILSMMIMGVPIFVIGLLPGYQSIGYAAPLLLVILRFISGISVGGEFPTGTAYLAEHAFAKSRGLSTSFLFFGINFGILLASLVGYIVTHYVSHETLLAWAWRVPFLLGGLLAVVGYLVRKKMVESPVFQAYKRSHQAIKRPLAEMITTESRQVTRSFSLVCLMAATISLLFLYMPTYLHVYLHKSMSASLQINAIDTLVFTLLIPVFAWLSDVTSRNFIMTLGAYLFLFLSIPLYYAMTTGSHGMVIFSLLMLSIFAAMFIGPMGAALAERFRTHTRSSGIGLAYNLSFGLVGGLAPLAVTFLIKLTGTNLAPAFYLMVTALLSITALLSMRDFTGESIERIEKVLIKLGRTSGFHR